MRDGEIVYQSVRPVGAGAGRGVPGCAVPCPFNRARTRAEEGCRVLWGTGSRHDITAAASCQSGKVTHLHQDNVAGIWQKTPISISSVARKTPFGIGAKIWQKKTTGKKNPLQTSVPKTRLQGGNPMGDFQETFCKKQDSRDFFGRHSTQVTVNPVFGAMGRKTNQSKKSLQNNYFWKSLFESLGKSLFESLQKVSKSSGLSKSRLRSVHNGLKVCPKMG